MCCSVLACISSRHLTREVNAHHAGTQRAAGHDHWLMHAAFLWVFASIGAARTSTALDYRSAIRSLLPCVLCRWIISLCVFVIAVGFFFSSSNKIEFDVPALSVGLLFALPFVREVQPDVPDVGATIDVFGEPRIGPICLGHASSNMGQSGGNHLIDA